MINVINLLFIISSLFSQENLFLENLDCGTDIINEPLSKYEYNQLKKQRFNVNKKINSCFDRIKIDTISIPIVFHNLYHLENSIPSRSFCDYISGNNETGIYEVQNDLNICISRAKEVLNMLNNQFNPIGIKFIPPQDTSLVVNDIKGEEKLIYNYNWNSIKKKYHLENMLNIYLDYCIGRQNNISGELECSTIEGWALYPENISSSNFMGVAIKHSAFPGINNNSIGLLAHEIGHIFSLLHLYHLPVPRNNDGLYEVSPDFKRELVSGNECNMRGDLICDTPGQPLQDLNLAFNLDECIYHGFNGEYNINTNELKIGGSSHTGSYRLDFEDYTNLIAHSNFDDNGDFWGTRDLPDSCDLINKNDHSTNCADSNYKFLPIPDNFLQWPAVMNKCLDNQKSGFTFEQMANIRYSLDYDYTSCSEVDACNSGQSNRANIPRSNLLRSGESSCRFPCSLEGGCLKIDEEYVDNFESYDCNGTLNTYIEQELPSKIEILELFPNPFNSSISIKYNLVLSSNVSISIYDIKGSHIESIFSDFEIAGQYTKNWNASEFSSGIYFIKLSSKNFNEIKKIIYLK